MPVLRCKHQRAATIVPLSVHHGFGIQKPVHNLHIASLHREHECRDIPLLGVVHGGLGPQEDARQLHVAELRRDHEGRAAVGTRRIHAGPRFEEFAHDLRVARLRREDQRRGVLWSLQVDRSLGLQEPPHHARVPPLGRERERRPALGPLLVDLVRLRLQDPVDLLREVVFRGEHERAPALGPGLLPVLLVLLEPRVGQTEALADVVVPGLDLQGLGQVAVGLLQPPPGAQRRGRDGSAVERLAVVPVDVEDVVGVADALLPAALLQQDLRQVQVQSDADLRGLAQLVLGDDPLELPASAVDEHPRIQGLVLPVRGHEVEPIGLVLQSA
mmetsp:Transcript_2002/g.5845  ORF Transcript_2002/g.5845 Transcript_2002/m.5845 type:complete len:329 (+) Transcript_2002:57-1043(+)